MANTINIKKISLGQFYTTTNPFLLSPFKEWFTSIPDSKEKILLEPFAGENNIVKMVKESGINNKWKCFDISPSPRNSVSEYAIEKKDTIQDFPKGFDIAITNPPYLAKNSATRKKLDFPETHYDDLYKLALDTMLCNLRYVAAIIPESFINADLFHERLYAVISLTCEMFTDTECPVCLALFVPQSNDFTIYQQDDFIGYYKELEKRIPEPKTKNKWIFNDRNGNIGIKCIDNHIEPSIKFVPSAGINKDNIKVSSRSQTIVSGLSEDTDINIFLNECNEILTKFREETSDIFLTSFKGLRKDGKYRRRLDFNMAKKIMDKAVEILAAK